MRAAALTVLRGFCMGAADIVPGVSGGTVALVLGIYHRLVAAIQGGSSALGHFLKLDVAGGLRRLREVEWALLLPLLAGILLAVLSLSHLLEDLLHDHPVPMAGLFLGLVAGSAVVAWRLLEVRHPSRLVWLAGAAVLLFVALGISEGTSEDTVTQAADPALWAFFAAGAVAICAMILPGVSGSFLLVVLGMYGAVLGAVNDRDLLAVALFALGCLAGLAVFSQALHWALNRHYDVVMAMLIGLMIGSTRVLWPWPAGVDSTALEAPDGDVAVTVGLALLGFVVVVGVDALSRRVEHRTLDDEAEELRRS
ncbi:MAG: DUF368 domain-containing protein [Acidimicrobiales bacterium]|nr:DUF368 domain-containing protein [Acidimicrobiales bacterium]MCB1017295.1 DUF368 domain-containing protein [Acidimicrobiales bacterium]